MKSFQNGLGGMLSHLPVNNRNQIPVLQGLADFVFMLIVVFSSLFLGTSSAASAIESKVKKGTLTMKQSYYAGAQVRSGNRIPHSAQ